MTLRTHLRRGRRLATAAAALALLVPTSAHAIVYGVDDSTHTNVGSFVMLYNPGGGQAPYPVQWCTGTLVSPTVVLTASHCMTDDLPAAFEGDPWFTLDPVIDANGDWKVDAGVQQLHGTPFPHPLAAGAANYRYDVGAFVLDEEVTSVAPARLAPLHALDSATRADIFVTSGYGIVRVSKKQATQSFLPPQRRMMAEQTISSLNRDFVTYKMTFPSGNGGTCYGDSGGPHFNAAGEIVAVTTTGDIPCKSTDKDYRVDTTIAREFLADLGVRFED